MSDLKELLERVKAATGPDRELDGLIHAIVADGRTVRESIHPQFGRQLLARNSRAPHDEYWLDHPANVNPPVTASIDAALALVDRKLPGTSWGLSFDDEGDPEKWWVATVGEGYADHKGGPALAILAALLSALASGASS